MRPPGLFGPVAEGEPPRPRRMGQASVEYTSPRSILTRATGFMDQYDFTLNPYSGCSFGCTYCYAAFFSRSREKQQNWGRWIIAKENARRLMEKRRPGSLDRRLIYMSSVTDPYQPIERELELTRGVLEVMAERHQPRLVVQTRSPDVVRDADLYREITARGGRVQVNITITTDDESIRKTFEPYCPSNARRLEAARQLMNEGISLCVTMTPLLLVRDAEAFVQRLLDTGVEQFIVQPFHFKRGRFVAGTRDSALRLMAEALGATRSDLGVAYLEHYGAVREVLRRELPSLGEGKDGFAPPF